MVAIRIIETVFTRHAAAIRGGLVTANLAMIMIMIMLASCTGDLEPGPQVSYRAADYAWSETAHPLTYARSSGGRTVWHRLSFAGGTITDVQTGDDGLQLGSSTLSYRLSSTDVQLHGGGSKTLPHIPEQLQFENYVFSVPGPDVHAAHWLTLDANAMLVSDDRGRLYRYSMRTLEWDAEDVAWSTGVTAMARDSIGSVPRTLCGTERDGLFARSDGEMSWYDLSAPAGTIDDLAVDAIGTVFVVIDGSLFQHFAGTTTWEAFPIAELGTDITSVDILNLDDIRSLLVLGRRQGGLAHLRLVSSMPMQLIFSRSTAGEAIIDVHCSFTSAYPSVAIADPPMLHVATQLTGTWVSVPFTSVGRLNAVCQSDRGGVVLIGTDDGVYRFDGYPVRRAGLDGRNVLSLHYGPDNTFYCGTTDGTYRTTADLSDWIRIDRSPVLQSAPTGLTLLPAVFSESTIWDAARLASNNDAARLLTGRILEHFDEFDLPDGTVSFPDVFVVRYAQEDPAGVRIPGSYYWTIYYARGRGPVYFEEAVDGIVQASTVIVPDQP